MSKRQTKHQKKGPRGKTREAGSTSSDAGVYFGFVLIGGAIVAFSWLVWQQHWKEILIGYVAALIWLTHLYAYKIYRGIRLANWQQALARIPLRFVGYGTAKGHPVEAAHDAPSAVRAITISALISILILVALAVVLRPLAVVDTPFTTG